MSVLAYHPETGGQVVVTEDQLAHMRASGWLLRSEWEENETARLAAVAAAAKPAKPAKDEGK